MKSGTIFALASGGGKAGVAVVRISGDASESIFREFGAVCPAPRRASRVRLLGPVKGHVLDEALSIWFPAPNSFTGENVVELHVHGGRAVIAGVLGALARFEGFRMAEPGEFTRRAFENGKMDLTAAEGLADLVDADTSAQRDQALRQMGGALGDLYEDWRVRLLKATAYLETVIDFAEEDIPEGLEAEVRGQVATLNAAVDEHLSQGHRGERLREGVRVAILGAPNAGKSSLLNRLAKREAAIVSETAGTTRDVIEVHLDLGGIPVILSDTAGIRDTADEIEIEGVKRALAQAQEADYKLVVVDPDHNPVVPRDIAPLIDSSTRIVANKSDIRLPPKTIHDREPHILSALTGDGVDELVETLKTQVRDRFEVREQPSLTRNRHRVALQDCLEALSEFEAVPSLLHHPELAAENLRRACASLGQITGRVDVEDLLDVIFRDFCIGK